MAVGLGRRVVAITDTAGTMILALQGAATAVDAGLDLYGVLVVAFATAVGGGILRDVLLGQTPPAAFRFVRYAMIVVVSVCVILAMEKAKLFSGSLEVRLLGAVGLGLFTVAGTEKALDYGCRSFAAVMIGTLGATGGGMLRDMLLNKVPVVLWADFYATAALIGAVIIVVLRRLGVARNLAGLAGGGTCIGLRVAAILLGWHLPSFR